MSPFFDLGPMVGRAELEMSKRRTLLSNQEKSISYIMCQAEDVALFISSLLGGCSKPHRSESEDCEVSFLTARDHITVLPEIQFLRLGKATCLKITCFHLIITDNISR